MSRSLAAIAMLALSVGACGLLDDSAATSPPGDGVSGFGDASPIELCLGTARVVAPSVASGGVAAACIRGGRTAVACGDETACSGIEHCICGRCVVEVCDGASSCGAGLVCRGKRCTAACNADPDCAAGEQCISGGCARTCSSDATCNYGETCDSLDQVCSVSACSEATPCGAGAICDPIVTVGEIHEPAIVDVDGVSLAFVEIRTAGPPIESAIYRARLAAPTRWIADPASPVLAPAAGGRVGAPSPVVRGGAIDLYYAVGDASKIAHAVSMDDGASFKLDASFDFTPSAAWENGHVGSPSVFAFAGASYLAYEGGAGAGIGLARLDGSSATRLGDGPVVSPATIEDPLFWRGITRIGTPQALVVGDVVRIYFTGRGAEGGDAESPSGPIPADLNDSVGLVTTRDLQSFERFPSGPVYARVTNLRSFLGEREAFVRNAGALDITFVATDASGASVSGLARATP